MGDGGPSRGKGPEVIGGEETIGHSIDFMEDMREVMGEPVIGKVEELHLMGSSEGLNRSGLTRRPTMAEVGEEGRWGEMGGGANALGAKEEGAPPCKVRFELSLIERVIEEEEMRRGLH